MRREVAATAGAVPGLRVARAKASMKARRRGTEAGAATSSDPDLLLYSRLMQLRRRRRGNADV